MVVAALTATLKLESANVTADEFVNWLKGVMDATSGSLTLEHIALIREQLAKVTPMPWLHYLGANAGQVIATNPPQYTQEVIITTEERP